MHKHQKNIVYKGLPLDEAEKAMIMVHGRGAAPGNILETTDALETDGFAFLAPAATDHTWYHHSFMAPVEKNEPGLSTGQAMLREILDDILKAGITRDNVYVLGFSQGACMAAEFMARNADRFGGGFIYSGGVIGEQIDQSNYQGDFKGTPILIGCSDIDSHVPLHRVKDTARILIEMGANVIERIYPNGPIVSWLMRLSGPIRF
jgi:phospholipase/carboxylesterase